MENEAPKSIGIIMDGNRRWARQSGLPTHEGHRAGYEKLKEVVSWAQEAGIEYMYVYAFSTENWKRTEEEKNALFSLVTQSLTQDAEELKEKNIRINVLGNVGFFPEEVQRTAADVQEKTKDNTGITLNVLLGYGGRLEVVHAVNKSIARLDSVHNEITQEMLEEELWSAGMPDPDLIIRTGGERRLSNFMPWQSIYSELFFIDTVWPAFTKGEFDGVLDEFNARERRKGA